MAASRYRVTIEIEADSLAQAQQVADERTGYDEDYGFDYTLQALGPVREVAEVVTQGKA